MLRVLRTPLPFVFGYSHKEITAKIAPAHPATKWEINRDHGRWHRHFHPRPAAYRLMPFSGNVPMACPPTPDRNDPDGMALGVQHRIGRDKPSVSKTNAISSTIVERIIDDFFGPFPDWKNYDIDWFLEQSSYTEKRKTRLKLLWEEVRSGRKEIDETCEIHIKGEFYPSAKAPRIISSRPDDLKALLGAIFKPIENYIFTKPMFIKHVPVAERAKYVSALFDGFDGQLIVNDHTSFETHAHTTMRDFEFAVYRRMLPDRTMSLLERVLLGTQKIRTRGAKGRVRSRMSGEMNTSLGNGLANFLSFAYLIYLNGGSKEDVKCVIEGDDAIFKVPYRIESCITPESYRNIGFVVEMERHTSLGRCGFCSTYFTEDGQHSIVEPMKAYVRIPWTFSNPRGRASDLCFSKAMSCAVEYRGVPILQALGQRLLREYPSGRLELDDWYERQLFETDNVRVEPVTISKQSRDLFEEMFGMSPALQLKIEEYFATCDVSQIFECPDLPHPDVDVEFVQTHFCLDSIIDGSAEGRLQTTTTGRVDTVVGPLTDDFAA